MTDADCQERGLLPVFTLNDGKSQNNPRTTVEGAAESVPSQKLQLPEVLQVAGSNQRPKLSGRDVCNSVQAPQKHTAVCQGIQSVAW